MKILIDTHIFLWWLKDDRHLSKKARKFISESDAVYISSVSFWEAAIKIQLGRLDVDITDLTNSIEKEGFIELPLQAIHAAKLIDLPYYHRDPFDRILIAQAIVEPLRFLTANKTLKQYTELVKIV